MAAVLWLKGFIEDRQGVAATEFALIVPLLLLLLVGSVSLFDMFRSSQSIEKATFTVGDVLSRQSVIDATSLALLYTTLTRLVPSTSQTISLRVTSVTRTNGVYKVAWSKVIGSVPVLTDANIPTSLMPGIADGDSVLITNTFVPHRAFTDWIGVSNITFSNTSVYRPRFVSAIAWQ